LAPTDSELMLAVQAGCEDRFEELVRRYRPRLYRAALSKVGQPFAEDIVQETLLAAFAGRKTFRSEYAFSTWIWTLFLNVCRRSGKRRAQEQAAISALAGSGRTADCASPLALAALLAEERRELLHALLDELPEAEADALRLRFFGGLKFDEIAAAMQSSLGGAKLRVKRGLLRLAARWEQAQETSSAPAADPASGESHDM
jgi:RNA polymerase sigma-70 factor (ECF subfamily)